MSKTFRNWSQDQALLLPPSVHDFVPAGHLSRFVVALVTEELDVSAIMASYKGEKGQPPYHPAMMVALLLYAYAVGLYSSRRIARACVERVDFMTIVALDAPDFRTISEFRRRCALTAPAVHPSAVFKFAPVEILGSDLALRRVSGGVHFRGPSAALKELAPCPFCHAAQLAIAEFATP